MTTTPATLVSLNALRALNGMPPLKAWKDSKAKLQAAYDKLFASMPAAAPAPAHSASKLTKVQRAKLRRAGFKAPYALDAEQLAILAGDKRKK